MDKLDLLLSRLQAAATLADGIEDNGSDMLKELKDAIREATVCAYRLRLGQKFESYSEAG
jgi:hypothetical protein